MRSFSGLSEFSLIDIIRARCAHARRDVTLGIGDDAALLGVPTDRRLAVCTDTLVEGVHFPRGTAPEDIGWKSLAVNLSDLAAMGAEPAWALLALTLPCADVRFVENFADGFAELARAHDVALVGGDTTRGPLSVTVTALGLVPHSMALTRAGARAGDAVFVTGTLGDAAAALALLRESRRGHPPRRAARAFASAPPFLRKGEDEQNPLPAEGDRRVVEREQYPLPAEGGRRVAAGGCNVAEARLQVTQAQLFVQLNRPQPRIVVGLALRGLASSCIDVSDGLLADLGHVCESSGVGAEIEVEALPWSTQLRESFDEDTCRGFALAGGDDYELCFTAPAGLTGKIEIVFNGLGLRVTRIGRIATGSAVRVLDAHGNTVETSRTGWEHFTT